MTAFNRHIDMLKLVARALGPELRRQMTFVGGCTTGLLLTDAYTQEQVRHTDDVDLIVHVMGYVGFHHLQEQLRGQGFKQYSAASDEDFPVCAMRLGDLRVDFMPDDETILGFCNRWYRDAVETATTYALSDELDINLINPVYFIATKLEAFKGRGNSDPMSSRDIEDILNLIDGREELQAEVQAISPPRWPSCYSIAISPMPFRARPRALPSVKSFCSNAWNSSPFSQQPTEYKS